MVRLLHCAKYGELHPSVSVEQSTMKTAAALMEWLASEAGAGEIGAPGSKGNSAYNRDRIVSRIRDVAEKRGSVGFSIRELSRLGFGKKSQLIPVLEEMLVGGELLRLESPLRSTRPGPKPVRWRWNSPTSPAKSASHASRYEVASDDSRIMARGVVMNETNCGQNPQRAHSGIPLPSGSLGVG